MNNLGVLIPILVPLGLFALIFGIVYMNKKENLAMMERGMNPRDSGAIGHEPFKYLKWGLLLVGAGIGLAVAYFIDAVMRAMDPHPLYFAMIAIGGGIGLIKSYKMEMKELNRVSSTISPAEQ